MRRLLFLIFIVAALPSMAQQLVAESQDPVLDPSAVCLEKPNNSQVPYAEVRVYTLGGLDVNKLYIPLEGRLLKIDKTPAYQSLFFLCDNTVTTLTISASGYGSLTLKFDSHDSGNISPGCVYDLKIRATSAPKPTLYRIRCNQYIELSDAYVAAGEDFTFEVEERSDYKLDYVMIDGQKKIQSSRVYRYKMPNHDIRIDAYYTKLSNSQPSGGSSGTTSSTSSAQTLPITVNGVSFNMIRVKGGTFSMGSTDSEADSDEKPVHTVSVSDFYIGETEVTCGLWKAVMGSDTSYFKKGDSYPVENVSWNDCQEFIKKLNQKTGKTFRLPTEAEWEYAARGGNKSKVYKYSGSNNIEDVAVYWGNSANNDGNHSTKPVKTKSPNELGLYDMSGNVYEWCNDWYNSDYYANSPSNNPTGASSGAYRVLRGGSWDRNARACRSANRNGGSPVNRFSLSGLRLALVP